jgi:RimJ/RimL family protein N-acetyltransferase
MDNKPGVFLQGPRLYLRPMEERDLETFRRWINSAEIRQYLKIFLPITEKGEREFFDRISQDPNLVLLAIVLNDGTLIGDLGLHNIHWNDGTAMTGTVIGEPDYQNKGYGTEAKMLLLNYAFNTLNLRKIYSSAIGNNPRSEHYNKKCGYKEEGRRIRQFYRNGEYYDEILLGVFKEDWQTLWEQFMATGKIR